LPVMHLPILMILALAGCFTAPPTPEGDKKTKPKKDDPPPPPLEPPKRVRHGKGLCTQPALTRQALPAEWRGLGPPTCRCKNRQMALHTQLI
jgi:hypothetical protein